MKHTINLLMVSSLLSCLVATGITGTLPGLAQGVPMPAGPETQDDQPRLSILSPVLGRAFGDESVVLDTEVENFKLVQPEPHFGQPTKAPVGHMHIYLDSNPLIATSSKRLMIGHNINGESMAAGWHSITVELVDEDHNVLSPRVYKQVQFYTSPTQSKHKVKRARKEHSKNRASYEDLSGGEFIGRVK